MGLGQVGGPAAETKGAGCLDCTPRLDLRQDEAGRDAGTDVDRVGGATRCQVADISGAFPKLLQRHHLEALPLKDGRTAIS